MADSLKTRVGRVIAGSFHALVDRLEDQAPEALMEQALREAENVIDDVRHELGLITANRHLSQQQHAKLNAQHERLSESLEEALNSQREDLVRAAVSRQLDIEAQLPVLETTLAEQARQEKELEGFVAALLAKQREMEEALSEFRKSRAQAAMASSASVTSGSKAERRMNQAEKVFDRVYQRQTGLSATLGAASVQQASKLKELDELVRDNKIAERIAQLKAGKP